MNRIGRGYSFEALCAKILFTEGPHKHEQTPHCQRGNEHRQEHPCKASARAGAETRRQRDRHAGPHPRALQHAPPERRAHQIGQPLAGRLRRERPDGAGDDGDGLGDTSDTDGELYDDEVGNGRSGRLVLGDGGEDFWAEDVGVDGAGASAEEAAVHLVDDDG